MAGLVIDGFIDVEFIAEGGLGRVYRATRASTGGVVAIKQIKQIDEGSPAWHRARREVEALVKLKGHPNVVSVEEIVDTPTGPCLVMEFLDGGSAADLLADGPVSTTRALVIGHGIMSAVDAAHRAGVIHRDLKPHNVLLGSYGQVKVCDFGIAAIARDIGQTQTNASTLAYASPEELDGSDDVGPPADIYSFSVTMAHLLTGIRPTFSERLRGDVVLPENVPDELRELLTAGMAIDPADRPTTTQFLDATNPGAASASLFASAADGLIDDARPSDPEPDPAVQANEDADVTAAASIADQAHAAADTVIRSRSGAEQPGSGATSTSASGAVPTDDGAPSPEAIQPPPEEVPTHRLRTVAVLVLAAVAVGSAVWLSSRIPASTVATGTAARNIAEDDGEQIASTAPATTAAEAPVISTAPTTAETTLPPPTTVDLRPPFYKLRLFDGSEMPYRFNPCQAPVSILLNPGTLDGDQVEFLEGFLALNAEQLSTLLGFDVVYEGITDDVPREKYQSGEEILLFFADQPGDYAFPEEGFDSLSYVSFDRTANGFIEADSFWAVFRSDQRFSLGRWVRQLLGNAFGLDYYASSEVDASVTQAKNQDVMRTGITAEDWGPGEVAGFAALGAAAGCF